MIATWASTPIGAFALVTCIILAVIHSSYWISKWIEAEVQWGKPLQIVSRYWLILGVIAALATFR